MVSAATTTALQSISDSQGILEMLEIDHSSFVTPVRIVNDTRNWTIGANEFVGLPFRLKLPSQAQKENPRAQLQIDNVGRELASAIEGLPVGSALTATIRLASRANPAVADYEFVAILSGISMTPTTVSATMGPDDTMRQSAVKVRFDPDNAPGLFAG